MRRINEINVHCAATRPGWMADRSGRERVAEIERWHVQQNGWRAIGYHYLIDRDGQIYNGRPVEQTGAFEPRVNATAIGICLLGGFGAAANDPFEKHYTPAQDDALRGLIEQLHERHPGIVKVTGHNDYSSKGCPGFNVGRWLNHQQPRAFMQSRTAIGSTAATAAGGGLALVEILPAISETRYAVEQAREIEGSGIDPLRWILIAAVLAGAAYALYRRWKDWQAGRQ